MRLVLSILLLLLAPAVRAADEVGPESVWGGYRADICDASAPYPAWRACLGRGGAPDAALALTDRIRRDFGGDERAVPQEFLEFGTVDAIWAFFPTYANSNDRLILVNGAELFNPAEIFALSTLAKDKGTRRFQRNWPRATPIGRVTIAGHRRMSGGIQRFVLAELLTNGCRACDVVGAAYTFVEFQDGYYIRSTPVGWVASGPDRPSEVLATLQEGRASAVQNALMRQGYYGGGIDGDPGPQTFDALAAFQRDHCLPVERTLSSVAALRLSGMDTTPAACAPGARRESVVEVAPDSVMEDGDYTTAPELCDPGYRARRGDLAYSEVISVEGATVSYGELVCMLRRVVARSGGVYAATALCTTEDEILERFFEIRKLDDGAFLYDARLFRMCPAPRAGAPAPGGAALTDLGPGGVLPFQEGTYSDDTAVCDTIAGKPSRPIELTLENYVVLSPKGLGGLDYSCDLRGISRRDTTVTARGQCVEAMDNVFTRPFSFGYLSDTSFTLDGRRYRRCVMPFDAATELSVIPLAEGNYATSPAFCPKAGVPPAAIGSGQVYNIRGRTITLGTQVCEATRIRRKGDDVLLEQTCKGPPYGSWGTERKMRIKGTTGFETTNGFDVNDLRLTLCAPPPAARAAPKAQPTPVAAPPLARTARPMPPRGRALFPLDYSAAVTRAAILTAFGAYGAGSGPRRYRYDALHTGLDIGAVAGSAVYAPVDGRIVRYQRTAVAGTPPRIAQSFLVLRGTDGRDYILGHVRCEVCAGDPVIGDADRYPFSRAKKVRQGDRIAVVGDLRAEGGQSHLHLGVTDRPIVSPDGALLPPYAAGGWAQVGFDPAAKDAIIAATRQAGYAGFIDPAPLFAINPP